MKGEDTLIERLRTVFVTIETFNLRISPLEKIAYGVITMVVVAVMSAVVAGVIRSQ